MKIRPLDVGVESIGRWRIEDETHLPTGRGVAPFFKPADRPLDEILRRPSLDERLAGLMQPDLVDPSLLAPSALSAAREAVCARFADASRRHVGRKRDLLKAAADLLQRDIDLDADVYESLAALVRG